MEGREKGGGRKEEKQIYCSTLNNAHFIKGLTNPFLIPKTKIQDVCSPRISVLQFYMTLVCVLGNFQVEEV